MVVTIHQPEFLPWLGFFHKMYLSDVMVLLDTVQFEKNNFQNRNQILVQEQAAWLTLPIKKHSLGTLIKDIEISWSSKDVLKQHLNTVRSSYAHAPYFKKLFSLLEQVYSCQFPSLADMNSFFIIEMSKELQIPTKIIRASELKLSGNAIGGTEVTLEICKILEAKRYISGSAGRGYLNVEQYQEEGIQVCFQNFNHPIYSQGKQKKFISHLSVIDLYFNHGFKSMEIIRQDNRDSLSSV